MSNLGRYQEFTTEAAKHGGVDAYLAVMQRNALLRGAGLALVAAGLTLAVAGEVKQRRAERRAVAAYREETGR